MVYSSKKVLDLYVTHSSNNYTKVNMFTKKIIIINFEEVCSNDDLYMFTETLI